MQALELDTYLKIILIDARYAIFIEHLITKFHVLETVSEIGFLISDYRSMLQQQ